MQLFTKKGYQDLLKLARANGYSSAGYDQPHPTSGRKSILYRHDVDNDLGFAVEMADIEKNEGVRGTYFVMLRSPFYNIFSRENCRDVFRILELGHWIGLHYDAEFEVFSSTDKLIEDIQKQVSMLEATFKTKLHAVSFHQPSESILSENISLFPLVNTYDRNALKDFTYISDSNKVWKNESIESLLSKQIANIQFLSHPMWWMHDSASLTTEEIWDQIIIRSFERAQRQAISTERAYGSSRRIMIERSSRAPKHANN